MRGKASGTGRQAKRLPFLRLPPIKSATAALSPWEALPAHREKAPPVNEAVVPRLFGSNPVGDIAPAITPHTDVGLLCMSHEALEHAKP